MITASSSPSHQQHVSSRLGPVGLRFQSILVATDYSSAGTTAVKLAARLAKEFHARLYVLHAVEQDLYASNIGGGPELQLMNLQPERESLHKYAKRIADLRTAKHEEIAFLGSPRDAIQSVGQANNIDLLVLGSRRRSHVQQDLSPHQVHRAGDGLFPGVIASGSICQLSGPGS
jgi:nucleotide-binding universal stress UspA family protein